LLNCRPRRESDLRHGDTGMAFDDAEDLQQAGGQGPHASVIVRFPADIGRSVDNGDGQGPLLHSLRQSFMRVNTFHSISIGFGQDQPLQHLKVTGPKPFRATAGTDMLVRCHRS